MLKEELKSIELSHAVFVRDSMAMADLFFDLLFKVDPSLRLAFHPRPEARRNHFRKWLDLGMDALRAHAEGRGLPHHHAVALKRTALGPKDIMVIRHAFAHAVRLMLLPYHSRDAATLVVDAFDLLAARLASRVDYRRSA